MKREATTDELLRNFVAASWMIGTVLVVSWLFVGIWS